MRYYGWNYYVYMMEKNKDYWCNLLPLPLFWLRWQQFCPYLLLNNQCKYLHSEIFIQANDVLVLWRQGSWPHKFPGWILGTSHHTSVGEVKECAHLNYRCFLVAQLVFPPKVLVTDFVTLINTGTFKSANLCLISLGKAHCLWIFYH